MGTDIILIGEGLREREGQMNNSSYSRGAPRRQNWKGWFRSQISPLAVSMPHCPSRKSFSRMTSAINPPDFLLTRVIGLGISLLSKLGEKTLLSLCSPSRPLKPLWQERTVPRPWEEQRWGGDIASWQHWDPGPALLGPSCGLNIWLNNSPPFIFYAWANLNWDSVPCHQDCHLLHVLKYGQKWLGEHEGGWTHQTHAGDRKEASWWKWYWNRCNRQQWDPELLCFIVLFPFIKQTWLLFFPFLLWEVHYTHTHTHTHTHTWGDSVRVGGQGPGMSIQYCSLRMEATREQKCRRKLPQSSRETPLHGQDATGTSMDGQGACWQALLSLKQMGEAPPLSHSGHQLSWALLSQGPRCWCLLPLPLQPSSIIPWGRGRGLSWMFRGPADGQGKRGAFHQKEPEVPGHECTEWHVVSRGLQVRPPWS